MRIKTYLKEILERLWYIIKLLEEAKTPRERIKDKEIKK